jgi:hypothetical protein
MPPRVAFRARVPSHYADDAVFVSPSVLVRHTTSDGRAGRSQKRRVLEARFVRSSTHRMNATTRSGWLASLASLAVSLTPRLFDWWHDVVLDGADCHQHAKHERHPNPRNGVDCEHHDCDERRHRPAPW